MNFPILYKKSSVGKIQYWSISTNKNVIIEKWGQVGGKEQKTEDTIKEGKNLGKTNETTPIEQAEAEAKGKWDKKVKKGYVEELKRAEAGKTDHEGGIFPMLAHKFSEQGHKIQYPAYVQPKLDGHRCIADANGNLWSRTRKPIRSVPHITKAILAQEFGGKTLDGELYNHGYRDDFEHITHLIRQEEPTEGSGEVQYHIYDVASKGNFEERYAWLKNCFPKKLSSGATLQLVETIKVSNEDEAMEAFEHFLEQGYEGAIIRNAKGLYVNKRSYDLQKIKEFDDAEFPIVGVEEGRGKLQGHVGAFICKNNKDVEFRAKMKGELDNLKKMWDNPKLWKNKILTVQYQGLTAYGIPRFPVGLRIRED